MENKYVEINGELHLIDENKYEEDYDLLINYDDNTADLSEIVKKIEDCNE